jgi:hypothetical protein
MSWVPKVMAGPWGASDVTGKVRGEPPSTSLWQRAAVNSVSLRSDYTRCLNLCFATWIPSLLLTEPLTSTSTSSTHNSVRTTALSKRKPQAQLKWLTRRYVSLGHWSSANTDAFQGASPRELIFESCRRNNTSLLEETIADIASTAGKSGGSPTELVAQILNTARDGVGNGVLHVAATYGSCAF